MLAIRFVLRLTNYPRVETGSLHVAHMLWGGLIAPLLWTGFLWGLLGVINPALNARVDWAWFIASQIAFGLATGFVVSRAQPVPTAQTGPPGAPPTRPGAPRR